MTKLNKNPLHYLDRYGYVISQEPDLNSRGGNSIQHTSMFILFCYSLDQGATQFINARSKILAMWRLATVYGEPRLHWNNNYWPGQPGHFSRDNGFSPILSLKVFKLYPDLWAISLALICRLGFFWNTKTIGSDENKKPAIGDFSGPLLWMIILRFKFNPLNIISDIYLFLAIEWACFKTSRNVEDTDGHLNLVYACEACRLISSNWLLKSIITRYRKSEIPQYAFDNYFDNTYSPPLHYLATPVITKW